MKLLEIFVLIFSVFVCGEALRCYHCTSMKTVLAGDGIEFTINDHPNFNFPYKSNPSCDYLKKPNKTLSIDCDKLKSGLLNNETITSAHHHRLLEHNIKVLRNMPPGARYACSSILLIVNRTVKNDVATETQVTLRSCFPYDMDFTSHLTDMKVYTGSIDTEGKTCKLYNDCNGLEVRLNHHPFNQSSFQDTSKGTGMRHQGGVTAMMTCLLICSRLF